MSIDQILGLVTGVLFGFLLQKGRVLRFDKQIGALLLKDMTILKFMLSSILVGMVGITLLSNAGIITLSHKPMNVGAVVLGGALFGAGWAIMGFCPGTSVGALGEGRWHAIFAVMGMVTGAAIYAELFPFFKSTVLAWKNFGKIGLPEITGVSPWILIAIFWAGTISLFVWFEKKGL
ncbi:MAG: putative inner membrane protein [Syntrophus sp. PtaB.Bin001]|nr:MAG: putative inner membrane protein [Syntrophus sp. PtaB.Bin001]